MMKEILLSKKQEGQQKGQDYEIFYSEGINKGLTNAQASLYAHDLLAKKYKYNNPIRIKKKQS